MLSRVPLISVVLLLSAITLIASVLAFLGAPMAGDWSAIVATVVAGALTIPMALAFSHHEHADSGH